MTATRNLCGEQLAPAGAARGGRRTAGKTGCCATLRVAAVAGLRDARRKPAIPRGPQSGGPR